MQSMPSEPELRQIEFPQRRIVFSQPGIAHCLLWSAFTLAIALSACSSSSDDDDQPIDDGTNGQVVGALPSQPQALKGVAYTDSQTEIFWAAATDPDGIVIGYDVRRNNELLVSELDARSYFDSMVTSETEYLYQIIAVDNDGNRSVPAEFTLRTPALVPVLNQENLIEVISYVFSIYAGSTYNPAVLSIDELAGLEPISSTQSDPANSSATITDYTCVNGGNVTLTTWIECSGACSNRLAVYDACELDALVWDGERDYRVEPYGRITWEFRDFSTTDAEGRHTEIGGTMNRNYSTCKGDGFNTWQAGLVHYEAGRFEGATIMSDVDTLFAYGNECRTEDRANLSGGFSVQAPETGNRPLTVTVTVPFRNEANQSRAFPIGRMLITAEDGTTLLLDADNDDPSSISITLANGDTVLQTTDESWDLWLDTLTFEETN